jgi:hypothetical protein
VRAAPEDLDLRHRHKGRVGAADRLVQRHAARRGDRVRRRERDRERRVRAETRLARRAVEVDQEAVERGLVVGGDAAQCARDLAFDIGDRALHVEAAERGAAVAQLDRLARPLRRARRADRASERAVVERHLGLDRRPAATVPDAACVHRADRSTNAHRASSSRHAVAIVCRRSGRATRKRRATRRTASRSASSRKYSTGDLPSTRASIRPGSNGRRAPRARPPAPIDPPQVGVGEALERSEEVGACRRRPEAFEEQVVEAKGEVERRVAPPRAFGVEEQRAFGPHEDVLRADVAVHQRDGVHTRLLDQSRERGRELGMPSAGGEQVGIEPDVEKDRVGREARRERRTRSAEGMDPRQRATDRARDDDVGETDPQVAFPESVRVGWQVLHHEHAEPRVLPEHARSAAGDRFVRDLHPARFVEVALDRCLPVGGNAQLGQGTLDTPPALGVDAPDVRRDAAGERLAGKRRGARQAELAHRLDELARHVVRARARRSPPSPRRCRRPPSRVGQAARRRDSISLTSAWSAWLAGVATPAHGRAARRAVQVIDLARLVARHVLRRRRGCAGIAGAIFSIASSEELERQVDSFCSGKRADLGDDRALQRTTGSSTASSP